jgi:Thioredoxin
MNYEKYRQLFEEIITSDPIPAPYDNPDYMNYVELNQKRQERWEKKGELSADTIETLSNIRGKQNWILITEPWCGDAAHSCPFIMKMAEQNPKINLSVQLRDSDSEIEHYLTNGGKSIPILVVRNENNEDLFVWGPRPKEAQEIHLQNLSANKTIEEKKIELQKWYNEDKGKTIQHEISTLIKD